MAIAVGILLDKNRQVEGEPAQILEVRKSVSLSEVKIELDALKAEAIDVTEETGEGESG